SGTRPAGPGRADLWSPPPLFFFGGGSPRRNGPAGHEFRQPHALGVATCEDVMDLSRWKKMQFKITTLELVVRPSSIDGRLRILILEISSKIHENSGVPLPPTHEELRNSTRQSKMDGPLDPLNPRIPALVDTPS